VLFVIWPYAATAMAGGLFAIARHLDGLLDCRESELFDARTRLGNSRTNRDLQTAYEWGNEWRQRYELQVQRCQVEHVDRPLPVMPLSAEQARELEERMPF
jgi:hypothetical protein